MIASGAEAAAAQDDRDSRQRLLRSIGVLAGSQLATWGLTLAWTVVVPRALGPKGIGELTTATSATSILLVLVELGLTVLLVRRIAQDRSRAGELMASALMIQGALYLPAVGLMYVFVGLRNFDTEQQVVLWLATAAMLPSILKLPFQSAWQANEQMGYYALTGIITKLVGSTLGIALVLTGFGVTSLAALGVATEVFTLWLNYHWSRTYFKLRWHRDIRRAAALMVESLPFSANYIIHSTYSWIDSVMLALMTSATIVGWYGVSSRLITTLFFLPVILSTALLPRLAASYDGRFDALQRRSRSAVELVLVLSLPIAVGAAVVSGPLIERVYGDAFAASGLVLAVLLASLPFTYFNILVWQVLVASSRQVIWTKVMAVSLVINVALNWFLIRYFQAHLGDGAVGSAIALVATEALMSVAGVVILPQLLNSASASRLARSMLATMLMAAVVLAIRPWGLATEIVIGVLLFAGLSICLRVVSIAEIRDVYLAVKRRRSTSAAKGTR